MRALVISDTHFGAWTGREIFLGDIFFLFGSVEQAVDSADGLLRLIATKMSARRLVFLAGNHDHHLVHRDDEDRLKARPASGGPTAEGPPGPGFFRAFLERRLPGVEVEIAYPTYRFAGVLCTHWHYLDPHARLSGSRGDRLLTRTLWAVAAGGPEEPTCIEDYESVTTPLTEWLYIAAQMPQGTHAQQNVFRAAQRAGRFASALISLLVGGAKRLAADLRERGIGPSAEPLPSEEHYDAVVRGEAERQAREQPLSGPAWSRPIYPEPTVARSEPPGRADNPVTQVVENLGWGDEAETIVFVHTHQPLADVRSSRDVRTRYWSTGSWIYEPDLGSRQAYARYLRFAWPGTAVLIDEDEPVPRLLEMLADLNPLGGGPGLPEPR